MTLNELIEALTKLRAAGHDGDAPVLIATQPRYPIACHLAGFYAPELDNEAEDDTVWLVEGEQTDAPYDVPEGAWAK